MPKPELAHEYVKRLFSYNPETGNLRWNKRPRSDFKNLQAFNTWNTKFVNTVVGSVNGNGYQLVSIDNHTYRVPRIIWFWVVGYWPNIIDHINGQRTDNRWKNLRSVTRSENQRNAKLHKHNISGICGIAYSKPCKKWRARITVNNITKHIGLFIKLEDAIAARKAAEKEHGFHPNHGRTT